MSTAIKRRRGTTAEHTTFTGLEGELTVDTTKDTVVVHDGTTVGGVPLLRQDLSNNTAVVTASGTQTLTNKTISLTSNTLSATSAEVAAAVSDETGTGALVFATSPTLVTPVLGTPQSGTLTNATGLPLSTGVTGTLAVANGGTGLGTLTANNVVVGNGTSAPLFVAPGTSGNVLTSNGTTWTSAAGGGAPGGSTTQVQFNNAGAFGGISGVTTDGTRMTASTTIGVGGATPSTSGSGISFPASASLSSNANTLDDYEEGTWTPVYKQTDGTVITTQSANAATFKYTKISNLVCLTYHYAQQTTNMTNVRLITGLPFSCETGVGFWFSQFPYGTAQPSIAGWEAQINNQAVQVSFVANQTLATTNNWVFTVTYFTTV